MPTIDWAAFALYFACFLIPFALALTYACMRAASQYDDEIDPEQDNTDLIDRLNRWNAEDRKDNTCD